MCSALSWFVRAARLCTFVILPTTLDRTLTLNAAVISNATASSLVDIVPLSAHIGAQINGVDLGRPLHPAQIEAIRAALLKWRVVFFREQFLSHEQHVAFSAQFGKLTIGHPVFGHVEGHPEVYSIAKFRKATRFEGQALTRPWTGWHTDVTAAVNPPYASILRGVTIPPYGGDTQWTNLVVAYEKLSAPLRAFVDGLRGVHRFAPPAGASGTKSFSSAVDAHTLVSEHPLVRVHPETGERALYVSPSFLKQIAGLAPRESQVILELLWEHVVRPEFTVRFKWEPGSIAFWDNRTTAHLAPTDIFDLDFDRQLYRTTLVGDIPVGPDGKPSVAIEGSPVGAAAATALN
jgi:alpha-ketoglutarate-dependent sulfate ester dioxygenase